MLYLLRRAGARGLTDRAAASRERFRMGVTLVFYEHVRRPEVVATFAKVTLR